MNNNKFIQLKTIKYHKIDNNLSYDDIGCVYINTKSGREMMRSARYSWWDKMKKWFVKFLSTHDPS